MTFRTDLAMEARQAHGVAGYGLEQESYNGCRIERMEVRGEMVQTLGKRAGRYITIEVPPISDHIDGENRYIEVVSEELKGLLPKTGTILVAGIGNRKITADALGPKAAGQVLATRHIVGELERIIGERQIRSVAVISPDVLGNTGMESMEVIRGLTEQLEAGGVIAIDALASRSVGRLGCTVQLSNAGIAPGSGIGNQRPELTGQSLGVPVIGIGIPTVVEAVTLAMDLLGEGEEEERVRAAIEPRGAGMVVTPREIDLLIDRSARLVGMAINRALNPSLTVNEFSALMN